jgi:hypothetical protein
VTRLRLAGPADVVAAVPRLVNFVPTNSLVALLLDERRLVMTLRVDLSDALADTDALLARLGGIDGARRAVWVLYEEHLLAHPGLAERLNASTELEAEDIISVSGGRWADYLCQQSCCPRQGTPIEADSAVEAELVAYGMTKVGSREERAAVVAYSGTPSPVHEAMADALQDISVRDGLLVSVDPLGARDGLVYLLDDLCATMRGLAATDPRLPRVAGTVAAMAYLRGDGALANLAIDRAGSDSMALLIREAIAACMSPAAVRDAFAAGSAQ